MDSFPLAAQRRQIGNQSFLDAADLLGTEPIILPQFRWSFRIVQVKYGLTALANHMDMRGPMIVRVDHNAPCANAKDRRHLKNDTINLSGWAFVSRNGLP